MSRLLNRSNPGKAEGILIGSVRVRNAPRGAVAAAVILAAVATALPGCDGRSDGNAPGAVRGDPLPAPADSPAGAAPATPADPRAETKADTLLLEGMPEPVVMTLVRAPNGLGLPFSTYLPPGLAVEFESGGDGAAVRFLAAFGRQPDPSAYLHVRLYPPGTSPADAMDAALAVAGLAAGTHADTADPPAWALNGRDISHARDGTTYLGRALIARHGDRFLHVVTHYPAEYGDGLGPRFARILHHWRWEDTGRMLTGAP
jgi:hypothetical protein